MNALLKKLRAVQGGYFERFSPTIGTVKTPTLIIWGYNDQILPVDVCALKYRHALPQAWFMFVANCGHRPQSEWADVTNMAILDFLAYDEKAPAPAGDAN